MIAMHIRLGEVERKLEENTDATNRIDKNTAELVAIFSGAKSVINGIKKTGNFAKWWGGVIGALSASYVVFYTIIHGKPPW